MENYLDIIYNYYPKDIHPSDLKYAYTPERSRYFDVLAGARENNKYFEDMTAYLSKSSNCENHQDFSLRGDLCRKGMLFLPKNHYNQDYPCCVVCVSVLANFYCIYFTKFTGVPINTLNKGITKAQSLIADKISRIIKSYYKGFQYFPMEYFNELVPHVYSSNGDDRYATYFDCLMTDDIF